MAKLYRFEIYTNNKIGNDFVVVENSREQKTADFWRAFEVWHVKSTSAKMEASLFVRRLAAMTM